MVVARQLAGAWTVQEADEVADEPAPPCTVKTQLVRPMAEVGRLTSPLAGKDDCESGLAPVQTTAAEDGVAFVEVHISRGDAAPCATNALLTLEVSVGTGAQVDDKTCQEPLLQARLAVPLKVDEFQLLRVTRPPPPVRGST